MIRREPREGTGHRECEACKHCQLKILAHLKRSASIAASGETRIMAEAVAVFGEWQCAARIFA